MAVGRRIRFFRLKNNMKQKELGLLLGFKAGEYGNFSKNNLSESAVIIRNGQIEKGFMVGRECRINRIYAKTDRRLLNNAVLILGNDYYEITR